MSVFLDTHAVVYLYGGQISRFGKRSRALLKGSELLASPAVRLELAYLHESQRLKPEPDEIFRFLGQEVQLREAGDALVDIIRDAMPLTWTRDPFDRLIVAHASLHGAFLVTRDTLISAHFDRAVW